MVGRVQAVECNCCYSKLRSLTEAESRIGMTDSTHRLGLLEKGLSQSCLCSVLVLGFSAMTIEV